MSEISAIIDGGLGGSAPHLAGRVEDIPPGWVLKVQLGAREVAIANCEGALYAYDNSCTHAGGPLGDNRLKQGCALECPWHNSIFDARTGEVIQGPARKPLKRYGVKVQDGDILVNLEG
jgi:nitrite reductase/ring-hydroxylating ferredoxin subunit